MKSISSIQLAMLYGSVALNTIYMALYLEL